MVRQCTGAWIVRLEGDEVYEDASARKLAKLLRSEIPAEVLSIGWPYYFFVDDVDTIVRIGGPHTIPTIAVRNVEGLHAAHHDKGGNETFWDEGWFDAAGKNVSVHHPSDNATLFTHDFGVHHYAWFKRTSRHRDYGKRAVKVLFHQGHPEAFRRHDFRDLMRSRDFLNPAHYLSIPFPCSHRGCRWGTTCFASAS